MSEKVDDWQFFALVAVFLAFAYASPFLLLLLLDACFGNGADSRPSTPDSSSTAGPTSFSWIRYAMLLRRSSTSSLGSERSELLPAYDPARPPPYDYGSAGYTSLGGIAVDRDEGYDADEDSEEGSQ